MKNILFILLLLPITLFASLKECEVKPSYDIIINKKNVRLVNQQNDLIIFPEGSIILNGKSVAIDSTLQKKTVQFQGDLRKKLPLLEQQAYTLLGDIHVTFEQVINTKLDNDSDLHNELDKLYKQLVKLLHRSINTENNKTYFYYKNFNNLKTEGETIGQDVFSNIISNSLLKMNFIKNYDAIRKMVKSEWKSQKPKLIVFDKQVCEAITNIDNQYHVLINSLQ